MSEGTYFKIFAGDCRNMERSLDAAALLRAAADAIEKTDSQLCAELLKNVPFLVSHIAVDTYRGEVTVYAEIND